MSTLPFRVVCSFDPAIDATSPDDAAAYHAYIRSRSEDDRKRLAMHPGMKPSVFVCRPLTRHEIREVRNCAESDRFEAAFVRGVVKVENLTHDGSQRDWMRPDDESSKSKPIPDSALSTYFDEAEIAEVGMVVMSRSFLAKRSGAHYPLPAISVDALRALQHHHAALTAASFTSASPKMPPAAESSGPAPSASTPPGDASTAATATASVT